MAVPHNFGPECFSFSPDGREIVRANDALRFDRTDAQGDGHSGDEKAVTVWNVATRQRTRTIATIPEGAGAVRDVAWSRDGAFIAGVTSWNGAPQDPPCELKVWNASDGRERFSLKRPPESRLSCVATSPDNRWIALGGASETIEVVDAANGKTSLTIPARSVRLAFHPSQPCLAGATPSIGSGSSEAYRDRIQVWDLRTGKRRYVLEFDPQWSGEPLALAYSPDGRWLAAANAGDVFIWSASDGKLTTQLAAQSSGKVHSIAFSRDGERLAIAREKAVGHGGEGTINVWDIHTAQVVLSLHGPANATPRISFSPDGHRLACVVSGAVYFWDATPLPDLPDPAK
jgi:WD40 repeat protein